MEKRNQEKDEWNMGDQISRAIRDAVESMDFEGLNDQIREAIRDAGSQIHSFARDTRKKYVRSPDPAPRKQLPPRPLYLPGTWAGPIRMILGVTGATLFGLTALTFLPAAIHMIVMGGIVGAGAAATELILAILTGFSIFHFYQGLGMNNRVSRIRDYVKNWRSRSYIMFAELQEKTGHSIEQIRSDIRFLLERRLLPGARMDQEETCLLLTDEAIRLYERARQSQIERELAEARRKAEEERMENASEDEKDFYVFSKEIEEILKEVDKYKKEIRSEEMRKKTEQFDLSLSRIFLCVRTRPEKIRKTHRLMTYYVPSVLKLLSVYEDMEKQPVQGENIRKTCSEIESSMDAIIEGLDVMYDELFQEDAIDAIADIKVLRSMLAQDGWLKTGSENLNNEDQAID